MRKDSQVHGHFSVCLWNYPSLLLVRIQHDLQSILVNGQTNGQIRGLPHTLVNICTNSQLGTTRYPVLSRPPTPLATADQIQLPAANQGIAMAKDQPLLPVSKKQEWRKGVMERREGGGCNANS